MKVCNNLPVPKLNETLTKYLKSIRPFVSEDELARSEEIVRQFENNEGPILQDYLEKRAKSCENWVSEWWDNMMYFDCRTPTTIFSSPGIISPFQNETERLIYATKLILGAVEYSVLIDKIHKVPGAHYEAASTKKYIHGRTETIRSCSVESISLLKISCDAVNGDGIDRHLFGLKMAARNLGKELPEIFQDISFSRSSYMRLDTSQVAFKSHSVLAFKPLVPDGYGCCYSPHGKSILFGLSSFLDFTDIATFRNALESSLIEMHNLLVKDL
ncbi:hypothetical protein WA026_000677 [Henosepilachna vigintioctopunctata]|uniref:Choline/carnitine acyltransferase domain-containing protein n=1 Tax=Henosepilachna vigintioctopunctata TaxID=420089 RepID=A0AAW1V5P8_9CUCU